MAEYKQWREEKRTYLKDVVPLDAPYNIKVEVSSLCNLKCVYCAHSVPNHGVYQGNMSMEIFEKILQDVEEFNTKPKLMEMYMFGEPLCNPNLAKMIKMAKDKKIAERVEFTTNGHKLKRPKNMPIPIFELIENCWCQDPKERYSIDQVIQYLEQLLK